MMPPPDYRVCGVVDYRATRQLALAKDNYLTGSGACLTASERPRLIPISEAWANQPGRQDNGISAFEPGFRLSGNAWGGARGRCRTIK